VVYPIQLSQVSEDDLIAQFTLGLKEQEIVWRIRRATSEEIALETIVMFRVLITLNSGSSGISFLLMPILGGVVYFENLFARD
jgi:hypothetical protein